MAQRPRWKGESTLQAPAFQEEGEPRILPRSMPKEVVANRPPGSEPDFKVKMRQLLVEAEVSCFAEVERLSDALKDLREENLLLKKRLDAADRGATPRGEGPLAAGEGPEGNRKDWGDDGYAAGQIEDADAAPEPAPSEVQNPAAENSWWTGWGGLWDGDDDTREDKTQHLTLDVRSVLSRKYTKTSEMNRYYKSSGYISRFARSDIFQYSTLCLVVCNSIWIAIDLDYNPGTPDAPVVFQIVESFFLAVFVLEMLVRFLAFNQKIHVLYDPWFLFDGALVLIMVVENHILPAITGTDGPGGISALRNLRLLRLARVAKICQYLPELQTMFNSMVAAMRSVLMTAATLVLLTYCFALLLRQLAPNDGWGDKYFSSVPLSMYNLLILSILPDHEAILTEIGSSAWYCGIIYFLFLLFSVLMVMNMLIAILCDGISNESSAGKDQRVLNNMTAKLRRILRSIDMDDDDLVSQAEFDSIITNAEAVGLLADVGVDVVALAEESDMIFGTRGLKRLPFDVFKEEVLKFRNNNYATLGSVTHARRSIRQGIEVLMHRIDKMEENLLISAKKASEPQLMRFLQSKPKGDDGAAPWSVWTMCSSDGAVADGSL